MLGLVRPPCTAVGAVPTLTLTSLGRSSRDGLRAMDEAGLAAGRRRPFFSFSNGETALGTRSHSLRGGPATCDKGRVLGDHQCERRQTTLFTPYALKYAWRLSDLHQGSVYDVTDFLERHPGGEAAILAMAGSDVR
jgi:hypothetical protein